MRKVRYISQTVYITGVYTTENRNYSLYILGRMALTENCIEAM